MFWINTFKPNKELVLQTQTPIRNGTESTINSYDTHQFIVKFKNDIPGVNVSFAKGPRDEVITIFYTEGKGMSVTQVTKLDEIKDQIYAVTKTCSGSADEFGNCVAAGILDDLSREADSKAEIIKYRDLIADRLRNYTCADEKMQTSDPLSQSTITIGGKNFIANTFLEMPNAKIWTVSLPLIVLKIFINYYKASNI